MFYSKIVSKPQAVRGTWFLVVLWRPCLLRDALCPHFQSFLSATRTVTFLKLSLLLTCVSLGRAALCESRSRAIFVAQLWGQVEARCARGKLEDMQGEQCEWGHVIWNGEQQGVWDEIRVVLGGGRERNDGRTDLRDFDRNMVERRKEGGGWRGQGWVRTR